MHPEKRMIDIYDGYTKTAMVHSEGNVFDSEKMLDCGIYTYYERLLMKKTYIAWHNEEIKKNMKGA